MRSPRRLWRSLSDTAPERHLRDLGAAADDDDALAEDLAQGRPGPGDLDAGHRRGDAPRILRVEVAQLDVEDARDVLGLTLLRGRERVDRHDLGAGLAQPQQDLDEVGVARRAHLDGREDAVTSGDGEVGQFRGAFRVSAAHGHELWHRAGTVQARPQPPTRGLPFRRSAMYRQATMTATSLRETSTSPVPGAATVGAPARSIRVGIIGAAGYVGGELIRLLERHPNVAHRRPAGPRARPRAHRRVASSPGAHRPPCRGRRCPTSRPSSWRCPTAPRPRSSRTSSRAALRVIDLGADYRLTDPADYQRWYGFEHPAPDLLARAVYGLPEQHRDELLALQDAEVAIVGSPGCYPTTALLGLAPLARAGLIGDLVVDAKSGVSGAGREPQGGPHVRRGQREHPRLRPRRAIATSRRSSRSSRQPAEAPRRTRARARSTSCPTSSP